MNDTLIALGVAGVALAPVAWTLHQRWLLIRPLQGAQVQWSLQIPEGTEETLQNRYTAHSEWLEVRWREQYDQQGKRWLLRATATQLGQLQEMGWGEGLGAADQLITRSQAVDLLTLSQPEDEDDMQMLEFFNVQIDEPNALVVSYQAAALRANSAMIQRWYERTATAIQKEAIRFFDAKMPKNLTAEKAKEMLDALEEDLRENGREEEWEAWLQFAQTWHELQDKDVYKVYNIKKPTGARIREAMQSLREEKSSQWSDKAVVVQRLIKVHPELELRKKKSVR